MRLNDLRTSVQQSFIFHPLAVLLLSITAAISYALWISWRFGADKAGHQFVYVVPIVIPFVAFLCDRAQRVGVWRLAVFVIDFVVVATSMMRVIGNVPYVSAHSFFLIYAILGPSSLDTRITASLVMIEVIYLKYFVWHDFVTSTTGIVLGSCRLVGATVK